MASIDISPGRRVADVAAASRGGDDGDGGDGDSCAAILAAVERRRRRRRRPHLHSTKEERRGRYVSFAFIWREEKGKRTKSMLKCDFTAALTEIEAWLKNKRGVTFGEETEGFEF